MGHAAFTNWKIRTKTLNKKPNQLPYTPLAVIKNTITNRLPRFSLPIGEQRTAWTVWLSADGLWARLQTLSQIAVLEGAGRDRAKAVFEDALAGADVDATGLPPGATTIPGGTVPPTGATTAPPTGTTAQ